MAPTARVFPARPLQALTTILSFTAVLWVVEFYDQLTGERLDQDGIVPRSVDGLEGILWAPLLHGGWAHLIANTLPFVIFGFLVLANGIGRFLLVTAVIWVLAGLGVWFTAPDGSVTVGMSGVIFGWLTYLLVRGFFARSGGQIVLALVVFFFWGGILLAFGSFVMAIPVKESFFIKSNFKAETDSSRVTSKRVNKVNPSNLKLLGGIFFFHNWIFPKLLVSS